MNECLGEKISVCLLVYNHVAVVESTLQSMLDQTIRGYEIIVSDDCSSDGTWEKVLEVAARDRRVKPVQTPHNMGMPGNANFAVGHSTRPYIALLHHDDLYREDLLEKWAGVLERNPDVSFVFNRYLFGTFEHAWPPPFGRECLDGRWFLEKFLFARWGCPVRGTAMIRRSSWEDAGGMRERYNAFADVDLWMRLSRTSQVGFVAEPLIQVRIARPDYYLPIYSATKFNWHRITYVYDIHAMNRLDYLALDTVKGRLRWWRFRLKLSCETAKWLTYAVIRRKHEMLATCGESATPYDLWPVRAFRRILLCFVNPNRL